MKEFPKEFAKHCPVAMQEKRNHKIYLDVVLQDDELANFAQCAFIQKKNNYQVCENCNKTIYPGDECYQEILDYYESVEFDCYQI